MKPSKSGCILVVALWVFCMHPADGTQLDADRPVDRYSMQWDYLPGQPSFSSPYVGNGNVGAVLGSGKIGAGRSEQQAAELLIAVGKNDFWRSEGKTYFTHLAGPTLSLNWTNLASASSSPGMDPPSKASTLAVAASTSFNGGASLSYGEAGASMHLIRSDGGANVTMSVFVGEGRDSGIYASVTCQRSDGVPTCELDLTLRECCKPTGLVPTTGGIGGDLTSMWIRKENLHEAANPAHMVSCSRSDLFYGTERTFVLSSPSERGPPTLHPWLQMSNGSCLWVLNATGPGQSTIAVGQCDEPQGQWAWLPASNGSSASSSYTDSDAINGTVEWYPAGKPSGWCLSPKSQGIAGLSPCGAGSSEWMLLANQSTGPSVDSVTSATASGYLRERGSTGSGSCLMAVPDNTNNTLAAAATVVQASSGAPARALGPAAPVNASVPGEGVRLSLSLTPGVQYTVALSALTLRDVGCAGTREQTGRCAGGSLQSQAQAQAHAMAVPSSTARARQGRDAFWQAFWNASSIDIAGGNGTATGGGNATVLERFYYGMQYALGANVRQGAVTPSLFGLLAVTEPIDWNDQLTLDYNLESVYWGAASSNRPELIRPYMATVSNPGLLEAVRQRATNPGVWNDPPTVHWPGVVGQVTAEAQCGGAEGGVCHAEHDMGHSGGYSGSSWPSTAFPLGDGRPAPTDLGTRFVGGLVATPMIQYFDHTMDMAALNQSVYPIVRDNAEFYASYAMDEDGMPAAEAVAQTDSDAPFSLPYTCAQEGCDCRNGLSWYWRWGNRVGMPLPNMTVETVDQMHSNGGNGVWQTKEGEHNAHVDIAFASQSLRKAIEYSQRLGVDDDKRTVWEAVLARMPAYPMQTLHWVKPNGTNVVVGQELSGRPMLVEAQAASTPALMQNATRGVNSTGGSQCAHPPCSTIIWPTCNVEYPITNFAAMWPTAELPHAASQQQGFQDAAKTTVYGLNRYTGFVFAGSKTPWANNNGFGLSWPPGVRVSSRGDLGALLPLLANAAHHQAGANGIVKTGGGCLENIGATQAINEMLLQSYAGKTSLFPVWDPAVGGPASFLSLRAQGGFLVSARVEKETGVQPFDVKSEQGTSPFVFEDPWGQGTPGVVDGEGHPVPVSPGPCEGCFSFETTKGGRYTVSVPAGLAIA